MPPLCPRASRFLGDIGEDDIEEQAQAFAEEIENLFCDDEEDLFEQE